MLCSKCYKRIPEGEEVNKPAFSYIQVNSQPLNHGGTICKDCSKKLDKNQWKFFISFLLITLAIPIISIGFYWWIKKN